MSTETATIPDTFTFASQVDQAPIFVRKWLPPCGIRPRALVQITHGIAEHSGRYDRFARFLAAQGFVAYAIDLRGHGHTAGPDDLGRAGLTAWHDMTADIKQLSDIAKTEYPDLSLIAFGHSMGSALTQSHIQNHGDLLAGAILCGTMGAMPGIDEAQYDNVIGQLHTVATGDQAEQPSQVFGGLLVALNAPFVANVANPTGSEWQTSDPEEIRKFQSDPLCGKPFSNSMSYSVLKGFHDLWLTDNESRIPLDLPDPDRRRHRRSGRRQDRDDPAAHLPLHGAGPAGARVPVLPRRPPRDPQRGREGPRPPRYRTLVVTDSGRLEP